MSDLYLHNGSIYWVLSLRTMFNDLDLFKVTAVSSGCKLKEFFSSSFFGKFLFYQVQIL